MLAKDEDEEVQQHHQHQKQHHIIIRMNTNTKTNYIRNNSLVVVRVLEGVAILMHVHNAAQLRLTDRQTQRVSWPLSQRVIT